MYIEDFCRVELHRVMFECYTGSSALPGTL